MRKETGSFTLLLGPRHVARCLVALPLRHNLKPPNCMISSARGDDRPAGLLRRAPQGFFLSWARRLLSRLCHEPDITRRHHVSRGWPAAVRRRGRQGVSAPITHHFAASICRARPLRPSDPPLRRLHYLPWYVSPSPRARFSPARCSSLALPQSRPAASPLHLVWAGGHVLTLVFGLWALKSLLVFWTGAQPYVSYTTAYLGAFISYGIVVYKSLGRPSLSKASLQRILLDENMQYLGLSLYWLSTRATPIPITLIPFVVFSLFHVLTFFRTTIIPLAFPPPLQGTAAGAAAPTYPKQVQTFIQSWVKKNYDSAMRIVAYAELAIFVRLLLGALLLRNSLLAPLLFAHFLRFRFVMSSFTRQAFTNVQTHLDTYSRDPRCPDPVRKAYLTTRDLLARYANSVLSFDSTVPATPAKTHTTVAASSTVPATAVPTASSPHAAPSSIDPHAAAAAAASATTGSAPSL